MDRWSAEALLMESRRQLAVFPGLLLVVVLLAMACSVSPPPTSLDARAKPSPTPPQIERSANPVLTFFGVLDNIVDPVQGAQAHEAALQTAGNEDYKILVIHGAAHGSVNVPAYLETLEDWLQHLPQ
jgi:hypothetical protein